MVPLLRGVPAPFTAVRIDAWVLRLLVEDLVRQVALLEDAAPSGAAEARPEDPTRAAAVAVHRRLSEWEGRAALTTWLFAIARRVAGGYRRKPGRAEQRDAPLDDKHEDSADTFAALSRAQAAATVMAILDTLDEDKRIVFALVELEQLAVPEVARMLGLNLNPAYPRPRLARAAFELPARAHVKGSQP